MLRKLLCATAIGLALGVPSQALADDADAMALDQPIVTARPYDAPAHQFRTYQSRAPQTSGAPNCPAPAAANGMCSLNFLMTGFSASAGPNGVDTTGTNNFPSFALLCGQWFGAPCQMPTTTFSGGTMRLEGNASTAASNVVSANPQASAPYFVGNAYQNGFYACVTGAFENNFTDSTFWAAWWSFSLPHIETSNPAVPDFWTGTNASATASSAAQLLTVTAISSGNIVVGTSIATGASLTGVVIDGDSAGGVACSPSPCTGHFNTPGTFHINTSVTVGSEAITTNQMQWFTEPDFWEYNTLGARGTWSVSGTTLSTPSILSGGPIQIGMHLVDLPSAGHVPLGTTITGGSGTSWTLSANLGTIAAESMSAGYNDQIVDNLHVHWGQYNTTCSSYCDASTFDAITVGQASLMTPHKYCQLLTTATGSVAGKSVLYIDDVLANTAGNNVWGPPAGVNNGTVLPPPAGSGKYAVADFQAMVLSLGGTDFNPFDATRMEVWQALSTDRIHNP